MKIRSETDLGHALREARIGAKLSQRDAASRAVLRQASVSKIENPEGGRGASLATLFALLTALNLEIELRPRKVDTGDVAPSLPETSVGFDPGKY